MSQASLSTTTDDGFLGKPDTHSQWLETFRINFESKGQYLIPILQFIQTEMGYLDPTAMRAAARFLRIPESKVYGVASFYAQFYFEQRGKHIVTICRGTACHVRGSGRLEEEIEKHLHVNEKGTTSDMLFTVEAVACVGACALAPLVVIDGIAHGRQTSLSLRKTVDKIKKSDSSSADLTEEKKVARKNS
jgi:NADH-quinone oxidoreductase subunit E